jgi:ArsR family transcriptional regulator, arsenate/arsenite/antimonite-responsive transcriptional repressor
VFYRLNPELPAWAAQIVALTAESNRGFVDEAGGLLAAMGDRPRRKSACC